MNLFQWLASPAGANPDAPIGAFIMVAVGLLIIGIGIGAAIQKGSFF